MATPRGSPATLLLLTALALTSCCSAERDERIQLNQMSRGLLQTLTCKTANPGQYKTGTGASQACVNCPTTFGLPAISVAGANKESQCSCTLKGPNYYVPTKGCNPCDPATTTGVSLDAKKCACKTTWRNWNNATGACTLFDCGANSGKYWDGSACASCPGVNTTTDAFAASVSNCYCKKAGGVFWAGPTQGCMACDKTSTTGVSADGRTCVCKPTWRNWSNVTGACTTFDCGANSGKYWDGSTCAACPGVNATTDAFATSASQCYCRKGGNSWWKPDVGCTVCDAATTLGVSPDGKSCTCKATWRNWSNVTGTCTTFDCGAGSGKYWDGSACAACPGVNATTDAFATRVNDCYCRKNGPGYWKPDVGCAPCGASTAGISANGRSCTCRAGFDGFDASTGMCYEICKPGFWRDPTTKICMACRDGATTDPKGDISSENACVAPKAAPTKYYLVGAGLMTCHPASTTGKSADGKTCACAKGFKNFDKATGMCEPNYTCDLDFYYVPTSTAVVPCLNCGRNATTLEPGSRSQADCICDYVGTYYVPATPAVGCKPCDPNSTEEETDPTERNCICKPGFTKFDPKTGKCSPRCPLGQVWDDFEEVCYGCLINAAYDGTAKPVAPAGSSDESDCACPVTKKYGGVGAPFKRMFYKNGYGCEPCPAGTSNGVSPDGRTCGCSWPIAGEVEFVEDDYYENYECRTKDGQTCEQQPINGVSQPICMLGSLCNNGEDGDQKCWLGGVPQ